MSDPLSSRAAVIAGVTVSKVGGHPFALRRLRFTDALARPFRLDVELVSTGGTVDVQKVLGQGLTVTLPRPAGGERHLHGVVRHVTRRIVEGDTLVYAFTIVPHIEVLHLGCDHRIFLDTPVKKILETVFDDFGLTDYDSGLTADYPQLEQCVQYGESHRDFVHRLLERFGISYYHEHQAGRHTLRLVDSAAEHGPLAGAESLPFHAADDAAIAEEHVHTWESVASMASGSFATLDYDYLDPRTKVQGTDTAAHSYPHGDLEWSEYPAGCRTIPEANAAAQWRMEERACRAVEVRGEARSTGLAVGRTFKLTGSPAAGDNRGYLVTGVELVLEPVGGDAGGVRGGPGSFTTACRFTAIPDDVQFRPARTTPVPRVHGVQSAVVVGPSGQDPKTPYTDSLGRIKVQFHRDRHGKNNENSSCWLRTPHQSAGHGYGHVWLPRIGCEVLVAFVDGDPDRPTIVGHVYNSQTTLPLDLPAESRVGIIKDDGGNYMKIDPTEGGQVMAMFSPTEKTSLKLGKT